MSAQDLSPVPGSVQSLLELFQHELASVKFPDVDADVLSRAAESVRTAAVALEQAEAVVEAAREQLNAAQEALLHKGQRALAYARVFAEEDLALAAKLDALALPKSQRKLRSEAPAGGDAQPPRRRGRPPKSHAGSAPLFSEGSGADASGTEASETDEEARVSAAA